MITSFIIRQIALMSGFPWSGNSHNFPQTYQAWSQTNMTVQVNSVQGCIEWDRERCEVLYG